ncbi:IS5 family transposase [Streptomyces anulatus]
MCADPPDRTGRDHRQVIDGVLYRVRTGVQWRDLPERYGPRKTVHERHRRWSADGTWALLLRRVQAEADAADDIDWDVSVDSTSVRAHQHAAGARKAPPTAVRGGFAQVVVLTAGQRADCTQFEAVMDRIRVPRLEVGRPRTRPDSVGADKAASRVKRGRAGGRPPGFDEERNTVERAINKLKNFRAVATRYDKRAYIFRSTAIAVALVVRLRSSAPEPRSVLCG